MNLDQIKTQWKQYDIKLSELSIVQKDTLKEIKKTHLNNNLNHLKLKKELMILFCGIVLFYLAANYQLCFKQIKYIIPFIVVSLLFFISLLGYIKFALLIRSFDINRDTLTDCQRKISTIQIYEKREAYLSILIACPLLLICLPPLSAILFNRLNIYENFFTYLPGILIAAIIAVFYGWSIYKRNSKLIREIERELREL